MTTDPYDHHRVLCDWLVANGVDINLVPRGADITVDTAPDGQRTLRCEVYMAAPNGGPFINERGDAPAQEWRTVPLTVEPPAWWQPHVKPTREQMLEALTAVEELHRAAEHQGQTICAECSALDEHGTTDNTPVPFPCTTVVTLLKVTSTWDLPPEWLPAEHPPTTEQGMPAVATHPPVPTTAVQQAAGSQHQA